MNLPQTPFAYTRIIRFQDTDAAGVVYFANVLAICHEAYEESIAASGINLKSFFTNLDTAIPIVHASIDFLHPLFCGDKIVIYVLPKYLTEYMFRIEYKIVVLETEQVVANAITKHVCINPASRTKQALTEEIIQWLQK